MSVWRLAGPIGAIACAGRPPSRAHAPTVVMLHGIQGTGAAWAGVGELLPAGWGCLRPDLRGRGASAAPADPALYTLDGFAADLAAVLAVLPGRVLLAGWSMGVLVALAYAARHGTGRLAGLVLAGGTACSGPQAAWFGGTTAQEIAAEAEIRAARLALAAWARPEAVAGAWMSARAADLRPALAGIDVPALVLHGADDDQCPLAHGEALAGGIGRARLQVWPQGGHNLMAQDAAGVAAAIMAFAAEDAVVRRFAAPGDASSPSPHPFSAPGAA